MPGVTLVPYSVVDNNVQVERWWQFPGTTKLLLSEYLKYLPALARLGATKLARTTLTGTSVPPEDEPDDAFVYLRIADSKVDGREVFAGWMFASSPALSAMDHQRYDVWVLSCTMS